MYQQGSLLNEGRRRGFRTLKSLFRTKIAIIYLFFLIAYFHFTVDVKCLNLCPQNVKTAKCEYFMMTVLIYSNLDLKRM